MRQNLNNGIQGSNQIDVRERNERLVLTILRYQGALPKAEIARKTGLSAQTTSVIMRSLEDEGLLEKCEKVRGKIGQPSIPMQLSPGGVYFFGLKVGRRSIELVLVDFTGTVLEYRKQTYKYPTPDGTIEFTKKNVAEILEKYSKKDGFRIGGLGIALPYFLWEWASVIGVKDEEMAAWKDCDLVHEFSAYFDFPILLGNDASCACGAELVFGNSDLPSEFLYLYFGYFIGGGVVIGNRLFTGPSGNSGALGPLPIDGVNGNQKQLIDIASLGSLERNLLRAGEDSEAIWSNNEEWNINPDYIEEWLQEIIPATAHAIASAVSIIDFQTILVDGSMPSQYVDEIVTRLKLYLDEFNMSGLVKPEIQSGSLGVRARPLGAASLPLTDKYLLN